MDKPYWLTERQFTAEKRKELAKKGLALPDGSFPIESKADLKNAIGLVGNSNDKAAAKRHVIKRAKALDAVSMLPESWGVKESNVDELLEAELSHEKTRELLYAAIRKEFSSTEPGGDRYPWVREVFDDRVIFEVDGQAWQVTYSIDDDDEIELGDPQEVEVRWVPVGEGFDFQKNDRGLMEVLARALKKDEKFARDMQRAAEAALDGDPTVQVEGPFVPLVEKAVRRDDTIAVKVIEPGQGSSGKYTPEVLERDGAAAFPTGTKMYWDHPTLTEEQERPERSLRDVAATLVSDPRYDEDGAEGPGLYADAKVFGPYKEALEELAPHIGVSIRAMGVVTEQEGESVVEKIAASPNNSIDFVTEPGAGGKVLELFESARGRGKPPAPRKEDPEMDDLKEAQRKLSEAEGKLAESEQARQKAEQERDEVKTDRDRLQEASLIREARDIVTETFTTLAKDEEKPVKLPEVTRKRLTEQLSEDPPTDDEGKLDKESLGKKISEAVKAEVKYLAEATGSGRVTDLGETREDEPDPEKSEAELKESFEEMGLGDKAASAAAKGR